MRFLLLFLAFILSVTCCDSVSAEIPRPLTAEELNNGWISLFDGKTLYGWRAASKANWRVEDEIISVNSGEKGLLHTTAEFGDFRLKLEFQCPPTTNSGLFLHTSPRPKDPKVDCYELNIAAEAISPYPTGSLVGRAKTNTRVDTTVWRKLDCTVSEGQITVNIDGEQLLSYIDPNPLRRGHIGLQYNVGGVKFRNIRLKPLGLDSLFNGKDLTGWKSHPESTSEFTVTEKGELNVKDGRGMLETEAKLGDFVLQLECISYGEHLNSGVFFRCIPGDFMMGYEAQIQNGYVDGNRAKPLDCGTGGIFRRQDARLVMADDFQWFPMTIMARGPHVDAWVNGVQVTDWTDTRKPDDNPRRGLRTGPGTIQIQGHDPTTNLSFRDILAVELPQRNR